MKNAVKAYNEAIIDWRNTHQAQLVKGIPARPLPKFREKLKQAEFVPLALREHKEQEFIPKVRTHEPSGRSCC